MKDKKMCKIVQDLLPNYVEKLTNEETNNFIEEHLKECKDCEEAFKSMQKEITIDTEKIDNREVKFLKKYSRKLKILRNILLIILLTFIIIVGRRFIILTNLSNKAKEFNNIDNIHYKTVLHSDKLIVIDAYYKEGVQLQKYKYFSFEDGILYENTIYDNGEEHLSWNGNGEIGHDNLILNIKDNFYEIPIWTRIKLALTSSLTKAVIEGDKVCYVLEDSYTKYFMSKDTGLIIKRVDCCMNYTADSEYEFGTVTDNDIKKPNS